MQVRDPCVTMLFWRFSLSDFTLQQAHQPPRTCLDPWRPMEAGLREQSRNCPVSRFPALLTLSRLQAHRSSRLITSSILEGVGATKQASPRSGACENGLPRLWFSSPGPLSLRCAYCSSSDTVWNAHKAQSEAHDRQFSRDSRARPRQSSVQGTNHMGLVNILAATSFTIFDASSATQDTLGKGTAVRTSNTSSVVPVRHGPQGVGSVRTGIRLRASALGSDFGDGPGPYCVFPPGRPWPQTQTLCDIQSNAAARPGSTRTRSDCGFSYSELCGPIHVMPIQVLLRPGIVFRLATDLPYPAHVGRSRGHGSHLQSWLFDDKTPPSSHLHSGAHRSRTSESARPVQHSSGAYLDSLHISRRFRG